MGTISSYSYGEISTFGGSRDSEFIMVVSPHEKAEDEQQRVNRGGGGGTLNRNATSGAGGASGAGGGGVVKTEKLVFTMPKLQVCIYNVQQQSIIIIAKIDAVVNPIQCMIQFNKRNMWSDGRPEKCAFFKIEQFFPCIVLD